MMHKGKVVIETVVVVSTTTNNPVRGALNWGLNKGGRVLFVLTPKPEILVIER